jgi:hypothetical protein
MDKSTDRTDNIDNEFLEDTNFSDAKKDDYSTQIKVLNGRIDELNEKINKTVKKQSNSLNCKIMGVMTNDGLTELSSDEAIQEAKNNGNDIIISCSL